VPPSGGPAPQHDPAFAGDAVLQVPDERRYDRDEQVYWVTPNVGEPYLTDRHGRSLVEVKRELVLAMDLAQRLELIVAAVETLTRGRIFGPSLERRLRSSIGTLAKSAQWNARTAAALEQAWLEEQEKQRD
jgi:hypothetical protein